MTKDGVMKKFAYRRSQMQAGEQRWTIYFPKEWSEREAFVELLRGYVGKGGVR